MRLGLIESSDGERPVVWLGEELLDLRRAFLIERIPLAPPQSVTDLIGAPESLAALEVLYRRLLDASDGKRNELREHRALVTAESRRFLAPVRPRLIVCSGHTYAQHVREMGATLPTHPAGFIKSSHTVIGPDDPIVLPAEHDRHVDFEGELACVIGRRCHRVAVEDAKACIAGYVLVNDVSARDWLDTARRTGDMFFNTLGKQFPTFCPLGPCVVAAGAIADASRIVLTTTLNGKQMQSTILEDLLFSIPQIVSFWSQWYEFHPGDVITTGSPPGVGAARSPPVYLRDGDEVVIEASGVGALRNPVRRARGLRA